VTSPAKVHSSDAIEAVRVALIAFAERVTDALGELSAELRRITEWLEHDRPRHWANQLRLATDQEHEAQQALRRCLMFPIADERPSCYEERMALKKAQARLEYCREKVERVRRWQTAFQHELFEYEGRITQLTRAVELDVPQAIAVLAKIISHLDEYQSLRGSDPRAAYNDVAIAKAVWSEASATPAHGDADDSAARSTGAASTAATAGSGAAAPAEVAGDPATTGISVPTSPSQE
jgi:hypothetical protein